MPAFFAAVRTADGRLLPTDIFSKILSNCIDTRRKICYSNSGKQILSACVESGLLSQRANSPQKAKCFPNKIN